MLAVMMNSVSSIFAADPSSEGYARGLDQPEEAVGVQ